jgi:hypothetical protein
MEKFQQLREDAKKRVHIADHILTQRHLLLEDPKLLLTVLNNMFLALTNAMSAVLYYERVFKKIPIFQETFESKYNMFQLKIVPKYNIDKKFVQLIKEIKDLLANHKKSPIEFKRKGKLVICDENYGMETITYDHIRNYLAYTKKFIELTDNITKKNEAIFKRNRGILR